MAGRDPMNAEAPSGDAGAGGRRFEIEGRSLGYPTRFRDGSSAVGLFLVPSRGAARLISESGFEVAEVAPGRAILSLACVHYRDSDCDVYNEISLAFFVKKLGQASGIPYLGTWRDIVRGDAVTCIWKLPVTTRLANDCGVLMWGLPKTIEEIDFDVSGGRATFALRMDGREVLRYSVRAEGKRKQPGTTSAVYSQFEGAPHVSRLAADYSEVGVRLGGGHLDLGDHPIADELRGLGLPRRPIVATWMGKLAFEMSAPEKL
jgi:hypothetical protein